MPFTHGKIYDGIIDLNVINNSHTQAFALLREHCKDTPSPRVFEVGCNTGYFSQLLKDFGIFVFGLEPFTDIAYTEGHVDAFFKGTVEDFFAQDAHKQLQPFDAVIFGDVLEHLADPENVLRKVMTLLKPDGVIIASVPNITHIAIRKMLENGEWSYKKFGILDNTHCRFFSRQSLRKLLAKVGLGIERSYHVLTPGISEYAPMLLSITPNVPLNEQDHTFQIVVRASRQALGTSAFTDDLPRKILFLSASFTSSLTNLRLIHPLLHYCRAVNGELRAATQNYLQDLLWADVLVLHRHCVDYMLDVVRVAKQLGVSIVYDLDDLLYQMPPWLSEPTTFEAEQTMRYLVATADQVTCTTPALKTELEKMTDAISVIPNIIFEQHPLAIEKVHREDAPCTFIVASTDTVEIQMVADALKAFLEAHPEHRLVSIGPVAACLKQAGLQPDEEFEQTSPEGFSSILLSITNGIGLIPLEDSLFSSCKSAIKFFHYTACGIVTLASNVKPYTEEIQHQKTGLLVENTQEAWQAALEAIVASAGKRRLMLARALQYKNAHASEKHSVSGWSNAFRGLLKPDEHVRKKVIL
jgi:2-polyprenyl-3-methyl-5-hydroxy-6-metoxy-1,4-benzoquinol methylase